MRKLFLFRLLIGSASDTLADVYFVSQILEDDKLQNVIQYQTEIRPLPEEDRVHAPKNEIGQLSVVGLEIHMKR